MPFESIVEELLSLITVGSKEQALVAPKSWLSPSVCYYVTNFEAYNEAISKLCEVDELVAKRFSRKIVREFSEKEIIKIKKGSAQRPATKEIFFKEFLEASSRELNVIAPLSGIRLDGVAEFEISVFKFGLLKSLKIPIANEMDGIFVSVLIQNVYDPALAIEEAESAFTDLARLISFLSGKQDGSIFIRTGLPLLPSLSPELMYVATNSYLVTNNDGELESSSIGNKHLEKIPINHGFFKNNTSFSKLWALFSKRHRGDKLTDMESRIINSALSLGESALTSDPKNSIIYTCIALETLFSFDEGSLFQKSIGEKLADIFAFVVAKDRESRLTASRILKKVYSMRSSIVHGGNQRTSNENLVVNILLRGAISELLNNEKFKNVSKISQLYDELKLAQYSY
jgi:hypothetical protein